MAGHSSISLLGLALGIKLASQIVRIDLYIPNPTYFAENIDQQEKVGVFHIGMGIYLIFLTIRGIPLIVSMENPHQVEKM